MIKTERKVINKVDYIVTDYMYNNDNVGINLNTLNDSKTNKIMAIPCIPISYSENTISSSSSAISVRANLANSGDSIYMTFSIAYPDRTDTQNVSIPDDEFATDMINTCLLDKKDIKEMPCYKNTFNNMIEKIKAESLEQNILVKTPELSYKCYIYTEDLVFLGTANRLLENKYDIGNYILGEYCGKNLTDYIDEYGDSTKLIIDMCVNKDITLQIKNVELVNTIDSSFAYATTSFARAKLARIDNIHDSISYKMIDNIILPEYKQTFDYRKYYETLLLDNTSTAIEKFFKLNRPSTNPTINVNKYLIW